MMSSSTSSKIQVSPVVHDARNQRFTCDLAIPSSSAAESSVTKGQGILSYQVLSKSNDQAPFSVEYDHVEIPVEFKGHDLGKVLANAAFGHAKQNNWRVKVTCPYLVRKYITLDEVKQKYGQNIMNE